MGGVGGGLIVVIGPGLTAEGAEDTEGLSVGQWNYAVYRIILYINCFVIINKLYITYLSN